MISNDIIKKVEGSWKILNQGWGSVMTLNSYSWLGVLPDFMIFNDAIKNHEITN